MTFNWFDSQHVFTFYAHSSVWVPFPFPVPIPIPIINQKIQQQQQHCTNIIRFPICHYLFAPFVYSLSHFGLVWFGFFMVFGRSFFICLNTQYSIFCDFFASTDIGDNRQQRLRPYNDITQIVSFIFSLVSSLSGSFKNSSGPSSVSIWRQQTVDIDKFGMQVNFVYISLDRKTSLPVHITVWYQR